MKDYTCAILLLMCGMAYSAGLATLLHDGCIVGDKVYTVGDHTPDRQCVRVICKKSGQVILHLCPQIGCIQGMKIIGYQSNNRGKHYPDCCPQPICKDPNYFIGYNS